MGEAAGRIYLYKDDVLVTLASLTEEEQDKVRHDFTVRMIENVMTAQGYKRVGEVHKK